MSPIKGEARRTSARLARENTLVDSTRQLEMLRQMLRIRLFEEKVAALAGAGEPVTGHLYIGQEAIAAGVCAALRDDDFVTSTHRGHGHIIAKGADLGKCMAELYGRSDGYCAGKGGSMHIAHMSLGIIGANGIVGAGMPIATGAGLSSKLRGTDQVSIAFFGEGAANQGTFHESLNLAAIWSLPVVFVCENNGWGELSRTESVTALGRIGQRAQGYGIPEEQVDGNDCLAVFAAAERAVKRARSGDGPTLIEAHTYRIREHAEGLARFAFLRKAEEVDSWKARDPIDRHRRILAEAGVSQSEMINLESVVATEVANAVEFARSSPEPAPETAFTDVFAPIEA